jgi:hypothetical protein
MRGKYVSEKTETSVSLSVPKTMDNVRYEIWDCHSGVAENSGLIYW